MWPEYRALEYQSQYFAIMITLLRHRTVSSFPMVHISCTQITYWAQRQHGRLITSEHDPLSLWKGHACTITLISWTLFMSYEATCPKDPTNTIMRLNLNDNSSMAPIWYGFWSAWTICTCCSCTQNPYLRYNFVHCKCIVANGNIHI